MSDCVQTVCELPLLPNHTSSEAFLHKSEAVRSVDWGAGLAVIGQICDIGKNVLQHSFQTESSSSSSPI